MFRGTQRVEMSFLCGSRGQEQVEVRTAPQRYLCVWIKIVFLNLWGQIGSVVSLASRNFLYKGVHTVSRARSFFACVNRDYSVNVENLQHQLYIKKSASVLFVLFSESKTLLHCITNSLRY